MLYNIPSRLRAYSYELSLLLGALLTCIVLILFNHTTIKLISGISAFTSGESIYSKNQKDAVRHLVTFIEYGEPNDYDSFRQSLASPLLIGDGFRALLGEDTNSDAELLFASGGIPSGDAENVVWLYGKFNHFEFMNDAIISWSRADTLIQSLHNLGTEIKDAQWPTNPTRNSDIRKQYVEQITKISDELTIHEVAFSQIMSDMNHRTTKYIFWVNTLVIAFMLMLVTLFSSILIRKITSSKLDLERKNAGLLATNDKLDNFIYVASHNLKSPINNIKGLINIWGMMAKTDPEKTLYDKMDESVNDLSITINRLEELMDIDSQSDTDQEILSFSEVFFQISEEFGGYLSFNKVNITTHFEVDKVFYSEMSLRLIILNLLSNSVKYRSLERQSMIEISTFLEEEFTVLRIKDNGLGMDVKLHGNDIYGMFRRYHENVSGIGVGLYLVKQVVDRNNGKIEVESELGKGTDFKIYLNRV